MFAPMVTVWDRRLVFTGCCKALDKDVEVIMRDPVPHAYQKLPGAEDVRVTPDVDAGYHAVFVIECSDISRPGLLNLDKQFVVNIDHHSTTALFGTINWIDSTASACGEMIYNLCKAPGVRVTKEIAECVYTALITDTGSFHFSNTTERTFKVASELVRTGCKTGENCRSGFCQLSVEPHPVDGCGACRPRGATRSGKVAIMRHSLEMQHNAEASDEDADGFVNYPLTVGEVEAVAMLKEFEPGIYRTSLRSKGEVNVAKVAEMFGGGGHRNAAGCTLRGTLGRSRGKDYRAVAGRGEAANGNITEDCSIIVQLVHKSDRGCHEGSESVRSTIHT